MSQAALLRAVRTRLQALFEVNQTGCDVMFDGQPPPVMGEQFIAIHPGNWTAKNGDYDLDEYYGVQVTITRRLGAAPQDRGGTELWLKATEGIEAVARKIIVGDGTTLNGLHRNGDVLREANTALGTTVNTFFETLYFLDGGRPVLKLEDWFSAEEMGTGKYANAGVAQTLTFGQARRLQDLRDLLS